MQSFESAIRVILYRSGGWPSNAIGFGGAGGRVLRDLVHRLGAAPGACT